MVLSEVKGGAGWLLRGHRDHWEVIVEEGKG